MADFLTAVKTTVKQESEKKPEAVLTAVSTRPTKDKKPNNAIEEVSHIPAVDKVPAEESKSTTSPFSKEAATPEEALRLLRSQPDTESLLHTLKWLRSNDDGFSLHSPGPLQAQIISTLVNDIVPAFWSTLNGKDRDSLLSCLRTVAGTNAVVARIRLLSDSAGKSATELVDLLSLATELFSRDEYALIILSGAVEAVSEEGRRKMVWKEFVNLAGSGKIISAIARAEDALKAADVSVKASWLARGSEYAAWLGRCVARLTVIISIDTPPVTSEERDPAASQLIGRGFGLGYSVPLVKGFWEVLIQHNRFPAAALKGLVRYLPAFSRRQLLESTLQWLSTMMQDETNFGDLKGPDREVSAASALVSLLLTSEESLPQHLLNFLSDPQLSSSLSIIIKRSCLVALDASSSPDNIQTLLEKSMTTFSDSLFINHAPILQQESLAQTLLLAAGHIHRKTPMAVLLIARSSSHMQGVSSRLDSTNSKARWLGMVIGTAISTLVDKAENRMNFGTDELDTDEAKWYLQLVKLEDQTGESLEDVKAFLKSKQGPLTSSRRKPPEKPQRLLPLINGKPVFGPPRPPPVPVPVQTEVQGAQISEILTDDDEDKDEGDDDDSLKPYAKPDSDPEDSDEDATLVRRNKPRPPVYIRDLMRMLHDDKDAARFELGIQHAAKLIRRKTGCGKEVTDHAEELGGILCNLQDPFSTDNFDELKLQALIAVLLADVNAMAPWFALQAFTGDYSISQRCIVLSAMGLGGRELAGLKPLSDFAPVLTGTEFPSKRLPGRLHSIYAAQPSSSATKMLETASRAVENGLIAPIALSAADKTTSHLDAVKVRTFSSRMEVQARTKRNVPANSLAKCFAKSFFAPLMGRYQREIAAYGQGSVYATTPFLLVTFVKTVAVLLHASGPATTDLGDVVRVFWEVLLSLRVKASGDVSVLEAVLFSLLTVLETLGESVGGKERLAREFERELGETKGWVEGVFERTGSGGLVQEEGGGDEGRVRRLAAGCLVRIGEVGEVWEKRMRGGF